LISTRLTQELVEGATDGGFEKGLAGHGVVVGGDYAAVHVLQIGSAGPVAGVFCPVAVKVADSVRQAVVAIPLQGLLHCIISTMCMFKRG